MFQDIKATIEEKRDSRQIYWKLLVILKDTTWKINTTIWKSQGHVKQTFRKLLGFIKYTNWKSLKQTFRKSIVFVKYRLWKGWRYIEYGLSDLGSVGIVGDSVRMEASSICQLGCPTCPTHCDMSQGCGKGYLKFKDFKNFIDKHPKIKNVELSNFGEIFLNPELKDIIRYAYEKKVNLTARNGANLNYVSDEVLEYLVKYRFKKLLVAIDGTTNETYQIYRKRGDLNGVLKNIKSINHYKKKYNSKFPKLIWAFIMFGHNVHEIPAARKMAEDLNMHFHLKFNHEPHYSPITNKEDIMKETGFDFSSMREYREKYKKEYYDFCPQLWTLPSINWDGKLLGCCINGWKSFGNVFESGLDECLNNKEYVETKKFLLGRRKNGEGLVCSKCYIYKERLKNPLNKKDIIHKGESILHYAYTTIFK